MDSNYENIYALEIVVENNYRDICEILISKGVDINKTTIFDQNIPRQF